jgi:hypothetical protein
MKTKLFQSFAPLAVMLGMVAGQTLLAKDAPQLAEVEQALTGVAAPELPVSAANLVSQSKDSEKESVTMLVVRTVSEINPASLPAVVGAIGRSTPTMASVAAANAITLQPAQAALITRAAVGAAPDRAGEIVSAILEKLPAQYAVVAAAAADAAPSAGQEILNAVIAAVPSMKPYIEKTMATATAGNLPVLTILNRSAILARHDQSDSLPVITAIPARIATAAPVAVSAASTGPGSAPAPIISARTGPVIGPPPVPLTTTPVEIDPGQTSPQTPGGRNYSSP